MLAVLADGAGGVLRDQREIPPLRGPTHSQERMRKEKASVCFGRNDRFVVVAT
jgi:hypothetical protein